MRVDLRGSDILVPKELLHSADVVPGPQQVRRKGVTQGMTGYGLCDASNDPCRFHRTLQWFLADVMPPDCPGSGIGREPSRREQVLPAWFSVCIRILACQRMRQRHAAHSFVDIRVMHRTQAVMPNPNLLADLIQQSRGFGCFYAR